MTIPLNIPHVMTARALLERELGARGKEGAVEGRTREQRKLSGDGVEEGLRVVSGGGVAAAGRPGVSEKITVSGRGKSERIIQPADVEKERAEEWSRWSFERLEGRLVEVAEGRASASLSFCARLIVQAQMVDVPVAWVTSGESLFFPSDMRQNGVVLEGLAIVRLAECAQILRGVDALIRSGAFGLVLIDMRADLNIQLSQQHRLSRLAREYGVVVVFLRADFVERAPTLGRRVRTSRTVRTNGARAHMGSSPQRAGYGLRVSLRVETSCQRAEGAGIGCTLRALKDLQYAPGWCVQEVRRGTPGLR